MFWLLNELLNGNVTNANNLLLATVRCVNGFKIIFFIKYDSWKFFQVKYMDNSTFVLFSK